jgi:DNA polymerase-3 subunit alpha
MLAPDLHCHSTFSMLDGMGTPKDVAKRAKELKWSAACLTEHGWIGSAPTFYKACVENGIKPIIGCEFYVVPNEILGVKGNEVRQGSYHLTVLALSAEGYHNLVAWTTESNLPENFYYKPRISMDRMIEIAPYPLHHNVILSGCLASELSSAIAETNGNFNVEAFSAYVKGVRSAFTNFYLEIQNHKRDKFLGNGYDAYEELISRQRKVNGRIQRLSEATGTPLILTNDSHYQEASQRRAHLTMTAQKRGQGVSEQNISVYLPEYGYFSNYMQSMEKIADRGGLPQEAIDSAVEIATEANIILDPLDKFSYSIPFSGYKDPEAKIRRRANRRLKALEKKHGKAAVDRFEHELESMKDFSHYLLIMSDFIIHARKQGILTNTRGSAANSLLCYCLRIHDIDSIEYGLTFSRFFNPARKKLPDIDIDIEKDRFEDFMQYVQEYMEEREGKGQVMQISNYGTLANRSSFRLVAEALGVPKDKQDEISKLLPQMIDSGMVEEENDVYEVLKYDYPEIYELASGVFDAIKNVSQHACGWLFGTADRPIEKWVPLCLIASSGSLVTQYNMKSLDDMGLVKGDFLRLRTLSVVQRTRRLLGQDSLDVTDIPLDDPETFQMLREGRTEGVFTLQGKENRRGVMETEVQNVHDVIAAVAIYRPALTREGKHSLYNRRRLGQEEISYAHPILEKILGPTHGVPIFQEQVMDIGYAVGMSDAEVDEIYQAIKLAKGVGRGAKEAFGEIKPKFYKRALKMMSEEEADGVWIDVVGSQGYGFNKGHASSYGILATRAAYLKCHHPAEFFTALLDVYPEKSKYVAAARSEGFHFLPPSVNDSQAGFSLDRASGAIRTGLSRVKKLGPVAIREIVAGQPYHSLEDFRERTTARAVNKTKIEILSAIGALEELGVKKTANDSEEFSILGFTTKKPKALRKIKPKHVRPRTSDSGWVHHGLERGAEITEGKASVSKLFWIPDLTEKEILELKASPYAHVKTYLLTVVDENGIAFQIMANEDKEYETKIVRWLAKKHRNQVICLEGSIRKPFLTDGPLGFRFYGISGADFNEDPQVWKDGEKVDDEDTTLVLNELHRRKRAQKWKT